jgi:putative PIG3 family NAD(P)H quinone oxidoreductase
MTLPSSMRYVDHGAGGPPSAISVQTGPLPEVRAGEVLVRVAFAGVNRPDVAQREGRYPPPPGASPLLGLEVSGEVVAVGAGVERWRQGDAVCALCNGGGYAEYVAVPAGQVMPVPRGLSMLQAAALPETFFTVWANVMEHGRLAAGETLLVHGGSSGIGLTAIQLAKARGAKVFVTVGNAEKAKACVELGADLAIDYRQQDFVAEVAAATGKRGVDVILDMVGGDYIGRNLRCLAMDGRLVQIAFLNGSKAEADWMPIMARRITWTGSMLRPRSAQDKARLAEALQREVWPLLEAGRALPYVFREYAMEDAADAHALMESSAHIGKIMLRVTG